MAKANQTYRVFVSSTYEDMADYRNAVITALTNLEILPVGMEQFVSSPDKPLDVCLSEVRRCQLFIAIVGMRYGSVDNETGKSYSELEYDEAIKNGVPVLAFIIDENECAVLPRFVDKGDPAVKLEKFKEKLNQKYASRFKSVEDLKELVVRAVTKHINDTAREQPKPHTAEQDKYKAGASLFRRFALLPERYKGTMAVLRIRLDGKFGSWLIREALFEAFGLDRGDTIFCNDATVLGVDVNDVDHLLTIDVFAEGKSADWILDNNVTIGTVIEGKFQFAYEFIPNTSGGGYKKAVLIMREGCKVIGKEGKAADAEPPQAAAEAPKEKDEPALTASDLDSILRIFDK